MPRQLETLEVFEWYDGLVIALVRSTWKEGIYLASLLAWSQAQRKRVYALIPVNAQKAEAVMGGKQMDWDALLGQLREMFELASGGSVTVVCCDEELGEVVSEISINYAEVDRELLLGIEEALEPQRMRWIDRALARTS